MVSACTPPLHLEPDELDFDPRTAGIPAQIEILFGLLAAGDVRSAIRSTDLPIDEIAPDAPLIDQDAYLTLPERPRLGEVGDLRVHADGVSADIPVTYTMGTSERTETLPLAFVEGTQGSPDHWTVVLDPERAGFDAAGAELFPEGTVYRVNGVDVTAAFSGVSDASPRVMAFAGTYPLEITVPGRAARTVTVEVDTLVGASGDDTPLRGIAADLGLGS